MIDMVLGGVAAVLLGSMALARSIVKLRDDRERWDVAAAQRHERKMQQAEIDADERAHAQAQPGFRKQQWALAELQEIANRRKEVQARLDTARYNSSPVAIDSCERELTRLEARDAQVRDILNASADESST